MLWVNEIMPSVHPRRVAREGVLEALFANQFSDERPDLVLKRILDLNPDRKKNSEFIVRVLEASNSVGNFSVH